MLELIFALQSQPPGVITEADFAALQQCLTENPPALGDNRCVAIDDGVAAIEACLDDAPDDLDQRDFCIRKYELECGDTLHAAGVSTNLLLRYCVTGNVALLRALNDEQWVRAEEAFDDATYARLRLAFEVSLIASQERDRTDSYELAWLSGPSAFYKVWVDMLDTLLREQTPAGRIQA